MRLGNYELATPDVESKCKNYELYGACWESMWQWSMADRVLSSNYGLVKQPISDYSAFLGYNEAYNNHGGFKWEVGAGDPQLQKFSCPSH